MTTRELYSWKGDSVVSMSGCNEDVIFVYLFIYSFIYLFVVYLTTQYLGVYSIEW
jgi:hypothetical protein